MFRVLFYPWTGNVARQATIFPEASDIVKV